MSNFKSISFKMAVLQGGGQNLPSMCVKIENCGLRKHLKLGDFSLHFYNNWQKSTWWLNGCHGYHTKAVLLILSLWRLGKIDLTLDQL